MFFFNFTKNGIRAFKHRNIGEGILIPVSKLTNVSDFGSLSFHKKAGHLPETASTNPSFWKVSPLLTEESENESEPDSSVEPAVEKKQFHCPIITCGASFDTDAELDAHWLAGHHQSSPMKMTLRDAALRMFSDGLEETVKHRLILPEVDDVVRELERTEDDAESDAPQGYALKKRKTATKFSAAVTSFLDNLFDEGIKNKQKISPEEAEKRMREDRDGKKRRFSTEERLNARQIMSYFSRQAATREEAGADESEGTSRLRRTTSNATQSTYEQETEEEDEYYNENAIFDDPWFVNDEDLIHQAIYKNRNELFDSNLGVAVDDDELIKANPTITTASRRRRHRGH